MVSVTQQSKQYKQFRKKLTLPSSTTRFILMSILLFIIPPAHSAIGSIAPETITYCTTFCAATPSALVSAIEAEILSYMGVPITVTCDFTRVPVNNYSWGEFVCIGSNSRINYGSPGSWHAICPKPDTGYNYVLNDATIMCERTVPDTPQYNLTITLSGYATTEPWHKKHDPEHLKANIPYKAVVTQNGQPKANIPVTITTDVTENSGGHIHTDGRPKGKLVDKVGANVSTKDGKVTIPGKTDINGVFEFTFGAEEASGTHTLTSKCDSGCQAPATATVEVAIPDLLPLGSDTNSFVLLGDKPWHPGNHYFSGTALFQIANLASAYKLKFKTLLLINDGSLEDGGVFDIKQTWAPSHKGHRAGIVVDINNYSVKRDKKFEELAAKLGINAVWEDDPPHYHLMLLGNGKDK